MSYADALRLLGEKENRLVAFLDSVSAGVVIGAGRLDLIEVRQEVVHLGTRLLKSLGERLRGVNRLTHRQRVYAAHAVLVITAFFEALDRIGCEFGLDAALGLGADAQAALTVGAPDNPSWAALAKQLANSPIAEPHALHTDGIAAFYDTLTKTFQTYVEGLAAWDRLDETRRGRFTTLLADELPTLALATYEEQLRDLATVSQEFRVWLELRAHEETQYTVRNGLAGLEQLLVTTYGAVSSDRRNALTTAYRAALSKPITQSGEIEIGLTIPSLAEGYVDHHFRFAHRDLTVGDEAWWQQQPASDGLVRFLAAHLVSAEAYSCPLLILGQPGSGKSVLTRVLAARLPDRHFLPVRVELRLVDADADLQDQIEAAIRLATGETVQWPRFVETAPEALPVVLLDGFDELLQATGVTRTDFLLKVARFQEREADQGRPLAVIVTSRTAVADRATLPPLTPVLRLEPFAKDQISSWLEVWNRCNGGSFAQYGLQPLSLDGVVRFLELAEQPLLLLMLALYDATTKDGLRRLTALNRADIYERLLKEFARRELSKDGDTSNLDQRTEEELERLSIVAFAMFNRRSQWVDEESLSADLTALKVDAMHRERGLRASLTPGQRIVGRFFFVHEAKATRDGRLSHTYEFLHSTFSEYLIARLVASEIADLASGSSRRTIDDAMLHAVLSFECLAVRAPIVEFLETLLARNEPATRHAMTEVLVTLHSSALMPRAEFTFAPYAPRQADAVERHAAWSANLVLMATLAARELTVSRLFTESLDDAVQEWHRHAGLWSAMLHPAGWDGLIDSIDVERSWVGDHREIFLRPWGAGTTQQPNLLWTFGLPPMEDTEPRPLPDNVHNERISSIRKTHFIAGIRDDLLTHDMWPISRALESGSSFFRFDEGLTTEVNMLLTALVGPISGYDRKPYEDLISVLGATDEQGRYVMRGRPYVTLALAALLIAAELGVLSADQAGTIAALPYLEEARNANPRVQKIIDRLRQLFPVEFPA